MMIRATIHFFLRPRAFIDRDIDWHSFDIERWSSEEYEWEQDEWGGLKDTVSPVSETLEHGGDCDDYALVTLSYLHETTDHDLAIAAMTNIRTSHAVTYDKSAERVYSSGTIHECSLEDFVEDSQYRWYLTRNV